MATTKKAAKTREVLILVRYTMKQDYEPKDLHKGDIVLLVRNEQNKEYYVTLRRNKAHSCTCAGNAKFGRRCYHIDNMVDVHNALYAARKAAKVAQQVVEKPAQQPVVSPVSPKEEQHYTMSADVYAKLASALQGVAEQAVTSDEPAEPAKDNVVDIGLRGSLNGNRGFQLMSA